MRLRQKKKKNFSKGSIHFLKPSDAIQKNKKHEKVINRHIFEEVNERATENRRSVRGREIYKRRKETVERSFADAKQLHGHRYARYRGLVKVSMQCLLCAAVQNLKKISLILDRKSGGNALNGEKNALLKMYLELKLIFGLKVATI